MIERLRSQWHERMSFDAIVELRDNLDAMLQRIRSERHIRPPILRCPRCGHVGEGAEPHVSVRAMILSLARFGITADELTHALGQRTGRRMGLIFMAKAWPRRPSKSPVASIHKSDKATRPCG